MRAVDAINMKPAPTRLFALILTARRCRGRKFRFAKFLLDRWMLVGSWIISLNLGLHLVCSEYLLTDMGTRRWTDTMRSLIWE